MPKPDANRERSYDGAMKAEGKLAEAAALLFLQQHPAVQSVDDLRDDPYWQERDVDFCAHLTDGRHTYVDAKRDVNLAGENMVFEILRINHTSASVPVILGWSIRSSAHAFLIESPMERRLYSVRKQDLIDAMRQYTRTVRSFRNWRFIHTDAIKSTIILLIPKQRVRYTAYQSLNGVWVEVERTGRF